MQFSASSLDMFIQTYAIPFGMKALGAFAIWVIGSWIIRTLIGFMSRSMAARKVDVTLIRYAENAVNIALKIVLVIAILSVFGIETTSFAAFLAAAGVAIGAAWSGLLGNFAAGAFLVMFRPFKVGDMITAGGVTGVVKEIGIFASSLDTADNLHVVIGNGKIFADNITNYTTNPHRRVELKCQIAHTVNPQDAMAKLKTRVQGIANVQATPAVEVEILEFNAAGTLLGVRPYCHNNHYWQVFFDTNRAIAEVGGSAGWPVPAPHQVQYEYKLGDPSKA